MKLSLLAKSASVTLLVVIVFLVSWESYCRYRGFETSYDDTDALWADKRAMVYQSPNESTVFIGSSRIKFDLDIPTWERLTGEKAVQLSIVGSSPRPVLSHLANDEKFKGKLVIDITEPLFFSNSPPNVQRPNTNIAYFEKRTPAQRFGFLVNHFLESRFAFLDQEYLSLNPLLDRVSLPPRTESFVFPYFPPEFERTSFSRQSKMAALFVKDTNLQKQMQDNWLILGQAAKRFPSPASQELDGIFISVKADIDRIRSRGGMVLLVRTPSSGPMWNGEQMGFPREKFWNRIVQLSNSKAIHFADYPETAGFVCPEWSHLSPDDARIYTSHLITQMEGQGWVFAGRKVPSKESHTAKN